MHVEVFPDVEISKDYKKIKLKKTSTKLEDSEVEDTLKEIQNRFTKFEEVS
jgi:FKBP-type peptidyl-prolyl cis-trans isomerase (trigger factor)